MSIANILREWFHTAPDSSKPQSNGEKILHDSFAHLQNFVEHDIAQMYAGVDDKSFRDKQKGLQGIEWLHAQKSKEPHYQSALQEIKVLYNWWVDLRSKRTDAWKDVDVDTMYSQFKQEWLQTTEDKNSEYKDYMDKCRYAEKLQTLYNSEDTKMLLRLIQIRNYL